MPERRTEHKTNNKKFNGWKWAFLILIGLLIGIGIWIFQQLQPVQTIENAETPIEQDDSDILFEVQTGREELSRLTNAYLEEEMDDEFSDFTFQLEDQAELHGEIEVFGFSIDISLYMSPYVLENGNLQLRGESMNIGTLNLPMSFAMAQLGRQLDFPEWIGVDSEEQIIVAELNEFQLDNGVYFSMNQLDLEEDDIRVNIHLPEEAVQ